MSVTQEIGIQVDVSQVDSATRALNAFAEAAERAEKAIGALNGHSHAGVTFHMDGKLAELKIASIHPGEAVTPKVDAAITSIRAELSELSAMLRRLERPMVGEAIHSRLG